MGLRRLLNRQTAAEPLRESLTGLAELAQEPDTPTPGAGPFAGGNRIDEAPPLSPAPIKKTAPQISVASEKRAPDTVTSNSKRELLDPRSWAAEKQARSRWIAGLMYRKF